MMRFGEDSGLTGFRNFNMGTGIEKMGRDMDGICIDSAVATETSSLDRPDLPERIAPEISALFELRLTSTKGYGLFAIKHIPRGTCVIEEPALIAIPADVAKNGPKRATAILQGIETLSPEQLDAYNSLHLNASSVDPNMRAAIRTYLVRKQYTGTTLEMAFKEHFKMAAIFNTCAVNINKVGSAVTLNYSRCNHSCTPNVANCFNTVTNCEMLHAVTDIYKGEELTTTYIGDLHRPTEVRREELTDWGFVCRCEACEGPSTAASAKRRRQMSVIYGVLDMEQRCKDQVLSGMSGR